MNPLKHLSKDGKPRYGCPVKLCDFDSARRDLVVGHSASVHGITLEASARAANKAPELGIGEDIVVGLPPERVTIVISNDRATRTVVTYSHRMADVVDLVAGALRAKR